MCYHITWGTAGACGVAAAVGTLAAAAAAAAAFCFSASSSPFLLTAAAKQF